MTGRVVGSPIGRFGLRRVRCSNVARIAAPTTRPAHRPSRRQFVIDGAIELFAQRSIDDVTVQDIADAVEMTPAAVYYHFASKEQIVAEGLRQYRDELLAVLEERVEPGDGASSAVGTVLDHLEARRPASIVYFVKSVGVNLTIEAVRRETRLLLIEALRRVLGAVRSEVDDAELGVVAVALVSLIETSAASLVNRDEIHRGLGEERFRSHVTELADRIAAAT